MNGPRRSTRALVSAIALSLALAVPQSAAAGPQAATPSNLLFSISPSPANEGQLVRVSGTFTDTDSMDMHDVLIEWGGTLAPTSIGLAFGARNFSASKTYPDDSPTGTTSDTYVITVTVSDWDGASISDSKTLMVNNVAPSVSDLVLSATDVLEHTTVTVDGSFNDVSALDRFQLTFDWGDGSSSSAEFGAGTGDRAFSASHEYVVVGTHTLTVTVTDDDKGSGPSSAVVTVSTSNTAPTALSLSVESVVEGGTASLHGTFTDVDDPDTHTASVDWGDGSAVQVADLAGARAFELTHTYQTAGTYWLSVTVADAAGAEASATATLVVTPPSLDDLFDQAVAIVETFDISGGNKHSLITKLRSAQDASSSEEACKRLSPLRNQLASFEGDKITSEQAATLYAVLDRIEARLGCDHATANSKSSRRTPR